MGNMLVPFPKALCRLLTVSFLFEFFTVNATVHNYTVTTTADYISTPVSGSLRYAIFQANSNPLGDQNNISFSISGSGYQTINLIGGDLEIDVKISIDGTTQNSSRDYTKNDPLIIINGPNQDVCFQLVCDAAYGDDASGSSLTGLTFLNFYNGIAYTGLFSTTLLKNITVKNCVFVTGNHNINIHALYSGIVSYKAIDSSSITGCYFGTNHYSNDTTYLDQGIVLSVTDTPHSTKAILIGGAGVQANVFYYYFVGIGCTGNTYNDDFVHRVQITQNSFLKPNPSDITLPECKAINLDRILEKGENDSIKAPIITSVNSLTKTASGTSGHDYKIEVFNCNGYQTAITYQGSTMADHSGNWSFSGLTMPSFLDQFVATATDSVNNTSELSNIGLTTKPTISDSIYCGSTTNVLSVSSGYGSYQWYKNGSAISGATSNSYSATSSGSYYVKVTISGVTGTLTSYTYAVL